MSLPAAATMAWLAELELELDDDDEMGVTSTAAVHTTANRQSSHGTAMWYIYHICAY